MLNLPTVTPFALASDLYNLSPLASLELSGFLDLVGLAIGFWTLWSSVWLPLGGHFQRAFRFIAWGTLAFACSHLLDSLIGALNLMSGKQGFVLTQGTVLLSTLLFVPGFTSLVDALPALSPRNQRSAFIRLWPVAVSLAIVVGTLSFIIYGLTPEAEVVTLLGLDASLLLIAGLCVILLLKARIGGIIGRSLWLAVLALLIFSLAHPLQIWLVEGTNLSGNLLGVLHRLIVMPALVLFAISITRLVYHLNWLRVMASYPPAPMKTKPAVIKQAVPRRDTINKVPPRATVYQQPRSLSKTGF